MDRYVLHTFGHFQQLKFAKVAKYLGYFCKKCCCPDLSKYPKSGHTGCGYKGKLFQSNSFDRKVNFTYLTFRIFGIGDCIKTLATS